MKTLQAFAILSLMCAPMLSAQTAVSCAPPLGTVAPTPTITPTVSLSLIISWTSVRGALGYGVVRKNPDGSCWNLTPQGTTSTSVQEPAPTAAGTYAYQVAVRTFSGNALSQWAPYTVAAPVIVQPPPITQPTPMNDAPPPAFLNVTGTPTTASLTWAPVSGAVSYVADRYLAGVAGAALTTLTPTGYTATSLSASALPDPTQTYTFRVTAYQKDGHFGQVTTDFKAPPPTNPTGLTGTANNQTVTLSWQPVQHASGYLVSGPGISGTQRVNATSHSFTAPTGTNVYRVGSVFDPGALSTPASAFPSVTVQVYAPVATCACTSVGDFAAPSFNPISGSAQSGSFSSSAGTFVVAVNATTGIQIRDAGNKIVLDEPTPAAWGTSPGGNYFFLAMKPASLNGPSAVAVYPVRVGPQRWRAVVNTTLAADGLWGFSGDGSMFILQRYQQSRYTAEAYNLLATTPQTARLDIDETNALIPSLTTSPCGDRVSLFRRLSLNPVVGEAHFYRRSVFPAKQEVIADTDGTTQAPSAIIVSPATNVFQVQLTGLRARPGGTSTFSSLQCTP